MKFEVAIVLHHRMTCDVQPPTLELQDDGASGLEVGDVRPLSGEQVGLVSPGEQAGHVVSSLVEGSSSQLSSLPAGACPFCFHEGLNLDQRYKGLIAHVERQHLAKAVDRMTMLNSLPLAAFLNLSRRWVCGKCLRT
jgi:hypothetical protein